MRLTSSIFALLTALTLAAIAVTCSSVGEPASSEQHVVTGTKSVGPDTAAAPSAPNPHAMMGDARHEQEVMKSSYCASCHADIYAEHAQNTHGRAFTDEEVRLATGRFSQADCIICHTPRPTFETGIGMNPIRRYHDLEEGNTCMTCHWKEGADYSAFVGGKECKTAFEPRVGTVEACASCHRNHGTPYQWEAAKNGKASGRVCIDCHMPKVERPVATGEPAREVHSHAFPASRSESQLRRAYAYDAAISGNEVVVTIENKGAGHNFPTELKQRAIESLVIVRDAEGQEIARSRLVFRDPYKRPYGLQLPVNTQIPSGEKREHRVPIGVANGTVTCELHYKLYYPIEDNHPDLARRLESRTLVVSGIEPSTKPVESEPEIKIVTPEGLSPETASPADLVDYARPKINKVEVEIPGGDKPEDIQRLIELFQFPVGQANSEARKKLVAIGMPAVPALITALGSWDNKTWNQAMAVLEQIGAPAGPAALAAIGSDKLFVRLHASELVARLGFKGQNGEVAAALKKNLASKNALDRSHAITALGDLKLADAAPEWRKFLADRDPDVVRAAARALAQNQIKDAIPEMRAALKACSWDETRRDVAEALAKLGDASGIPVLLAGLDHGDDLVRESFFEAFFGVTALHMGYEPLAPKDERLEALSKLQAYWSANGGDDKLRHPIVVDWKTRSEVKKISEAIGGGDGATPAGDDAQLRQRLVELGEKAVPGLTQIGLKYPPGFADKRALICDILGEINNSDAVPALIAALRDPVISVASWAAFSLGKIGDASALPALQRYHLRLLSLASQGRIPAGAGSPDLVLAQAASARYIVGDARAQDDLVHYLLSEDAAARAVAFTALRTGGARDLDYDPAAAPEDRRAAIFRWQTNR